MRIAFNAYNVSRNLAVSSTPVLAYHLTELLSSGAFLDLVFQIVYAGSALFAFMAFLQATVHVVSDYTVDGDP